MEPCILWIWAGLYSPRDLDMIYLMGWGPGAQPPASRYIFGAQAQAQSISQNSLRPQATVRMERLKERSKVFICKYCECRRRH